MRFAYADPPYIGCAAKHYGDPFYDSIQNQVDLLDKINNEYEAWAFSLHEPSLRRLLPFAPLGCRVAVWVKPFAVFKRGVDPAYTWEPVFFKTARKWDKGRPTVRDHLSCNIALKKGLVGAKPDKFWLWLFELLGATPGDEFYDVFPGTGRGQTMWQEYQTNWLRAQLEE